ncbi:MAG: CHAP domain-containing protein [Ruminococcaceae bacterium]|nr:CHAP domain-containing protein [Oscillospiraceae bacterium]
MKQRLEAALAAARWLGAKEGSKEHRRILEVYNSIRPLPRGYQLTERDPWCAAFVSAAAVMAGVGDLLPLECSCSRIVEKAKSMGIWVETDGHVPQIGDWVLYNWDAKKFGDDTGAPDHVGIVIGMENGELLVAEGNYDNMVKLRRVPIDGEKIRGFVCPRLEEKELRYHTLEEVPAYARETIERLTDDGSLQGIAADDLGLTEELIRILVILDRRGVL